MSGATGTETFTYIFGQDATSGGTQQDTIVVST